MLTKKGLSRLIDDLAIICITIEDVNNLVDFNMEFFPFSVSEAEFERIDFEYLIGYFIKVTDYIFDYAIANEVYEVCTKLEQIKLILKLNIFH